MRLLRKHYYLPLIIVLVALSATIITTKSIATKKTKSAVPRGVNVSTIESLNEDMRRLKESIDNLNAWNIAFLVATFLSAGGLAVFGFVLNEKTKRLIDAQDVVGDLKDRAVEEMKRQNSELVQSLAPRDFPSAKSDIKDTKKWEEEFRAIKARIDELRKFSGISATIDVIPDFEARRAAHVIEAIVVQNAGWNPIPITVVDSPTIRDGVVIRRHASADLTGSLTPGSKAYSDEANSREAAEGLANCLIKFGWQDVSVEMGSRAASPFQVPAGNIRIEVGFKPASFFEPERIKKLKKKTEEMSK